MYNKDQLNINMGFESMIPKPCKKEVDEREIYNSNLSFSLFGYTFCISINFKSAR